MHFQILEPTKTFWGYLQRSVSYSNPPNQPERSKYECQSKRMIDNFEAGEDVTQTEKKLSDIAFSLEF